MTSIPEAKVALLQVSQKMDEIQAGINQLNQMTEEAFGLVIAWFPDDSIEQGNQIKAMLTTGDAAIDGSVGDALNKAQLAANTTKELADTYNSILG